MLPQAGDPGSAFINYTRVVYPERMKILVVRDTIAPRPAYEPLPQDQRGESPARTAVTRRGSL